MRANSLAGQVIAVMSRRAPAFQPLPGEPSTFPGQVRQAALALGETRGQEARSADSGVRYPAQESGSDTIIIPPEGWPWSRHSTATAARPARHRSPNSVSSLSLQFLALL